jgi:hypothetical protein
MSEFLDTLSKSELGQKQHMIGPIQTEILGEEAFKVTIIFRQYADFLVESSFKDGMLRHWGNLFSEVMNDPDGAWTDYPKRK